MLELCDACDAPVRATWRATKGFDMLTLCAHHTSKHRPALMDRGWLICLLPTVSSSSVPA